MKEAIIQYNDDPDTDGNHMVISWKPLVRCKDCRFYQEEFGYCGQAHGMTLKPSDWFCADGERKESK